MPCLRSSPGKPFERGRSSKLEDGCGLFLLWLTAQFLELWGTTTLPSKCLSCGAHGGLVALYDHPGGTWVDEQLLTLQELPQVQYFSILVAFSFKVWLSLLLFGSVSPGNFIRGKPSVGSSCDFSEYGQPGNLLFSSILVPLPIRSSMRCRPCFRWYLACA